MERPIVLHCQLKLLSNSELSWTANTKKLDRLSLLKLEGGGSEKIDTMDTTVQNEPVQREAVAVGSPHPGPSESREVRKTTTDPFTSDSLIDGQKTDHSPTPAPTKEMDTEGIRYPILFPNFLFIFFQHLSMIIQNTMCISDKAPFPS